MGGGWRLDLLGLRDEGLGSFGGGMMVLVMRDAG